MKQQGSDFTGTSTSAVGSGTFQNGKVSGNRVTAILQSDVQGNPTTITFSGTLAGDKMTGTMDVPGFGNLPFTGTRKN
jgi:hypothetical protein